MYTHQRDKLKTSSGFCLESILKDSMQCSNVLQRYDFSCLTKKTWSATIFNLYAIMPGELEGLLLLILGATSTNPIFKLRANITPGKVIITAYGADAEVNSELTYGWSMSKLISPHISRGFQKR